MPLTTQEERNYKIAIAAANYTTVLLDGNEFSPCPACYATGITHIQRVAQICVECGGKGYIEKPFIAGEKQEEAA